MNYLRKKLQAIMACADFKGYLREVTGTDSVTLTDCMGSDLVSLSVTGNAVQDGTPSPDNPVEIQGCGDRTANLFDVSLKYGGSWSSAVIDDSGWVTYDYINPNDTTAYPAFFTRANAEIKPDTTYTVITEIESISGCRFDPTSIRGASDIYQGQLQNSQNYYETAGTYVLSANSLSDLSGANRFLTTRLVVAANATAHIKFRLSVLEGSHTAETIPQYEPYGYKVPVKVGGINLFNLIGRTEVQLNGGPNAAKEIPDNSILLNVSFNGFNYPGYLTSYSVDDNCVTIVPSGNSGYGLGFSFSVAEGDTYTMSYSADALAEVYASFYDTEGIYLSSSASKQITVPPNAVMMVITTAKKYESHNDNIGIPISVTNLMLVQGTYTADTMPAYEPYHEPQEFAVYMDKPLYGLRLATDSTGYYTYQDDDGNKYLCDTIAIDFGKRTAKRTDNLKYRSLGDVARWSEYTGILYDDVYHMFTVNSVNPGQKIKTYYTDTDGTNKDWGVDSIVSNVMPTDSTYPVNTTPTVCTGAAPGIFADCIRYWFLKTDVDAYTGDTVRDRVAAYWEDFCADRDVMALYITNPTTTDISAMQDWDTIPKLWRGTAIATVKTTVPTKTITARYYAAKKED